ncbi:glycosyltransferase family 4 protein [Arthrobacter sp. ISL-69]|uniref:glycosyltransferase family 4 protein n=1 Tax=Arthrobacter sp. ISL-69 TaxID=2819113 RepID=UPI001BE8045E|nr:glycosyltransferase family 4 protein [Arthrobacter sp. ISL-69]MBT2538270.1 glycosyltransferase family 4 protein [Arthrobacter sp. ISL-69]
MKLAVFLKAPEVWGAERSLLTLLASGPAKDHLIEIFVSPKSPLCEELDRLGIKWTAFNFVSHRSIADGGLKNASPLSVVLDLFQIFMGGLKARRRVKQFDAVLTFGLWETPEIALAGRLSRTPVIFDFHVTFSGRTGQLALKQIMRLVTGVIAPAKATYTQAGIDSHSLSCRQVVVPRPVTTPAVRENTQISPQARRLRVGMFGQVDDRKGILEVIETLSPLAGEVELLIVGVRPTAFRTDYERTVLANIEAVGHGWTALPRSTDVSALMSRCDVVLNMSRHEAFGRTVVEAACVGTVPLVFSGGGPEEIVNDMGAGIVVHSWEDLRARMAELSRSAAAGADLKLTNDQVQAIRHNYSPGVLAEKYFQKVQVLASPGRR